MLTDVITVRDLHRMAQEAVELGDLSSASEFLQRAYKLALAVSNHNPCQDSVESLLRLARFYRSLGRLSAACSYYDQAIMESMSVFGAETPKTIEVCREYGMLLTCLTIMQEASTRRLQ